MRQEHREIVEHTEFSQLTYIDTTYVLLPCYKEKQKDVSKLLISIFLISVPLL